jgi:hypothetical protein
VSMRALSQERIPPGRSTEIRHARPDALPASRASWMFLGSGRHGSERCAALQRSSGVSGQVACSEGPLPTRSPAVESSDFPPSTAVAVQFRAYPIRPEARQVMIPQARWSMAKKVSSRFSQRMRMRRKRFIQL